MKNSTNEGLLTSEQAAVMAGMSRQALLGHVAAGRLKPVVVLGRRNLFSRESVRQWLRSRKKDGITKRGPQPQNGNK